MGTGDGSFFYDTFHVFHLKIRMRPVSVCKCARGRDGDQNYLNIEMENKMNRIEKRILSTFFALLLVLGMAIPTLAAKNVTELSMPELEKILDDVVAWAKENGDSDDPLAFYAQMAGSTYGDWMPIGIGRYGVDADYQNFLEAITTYVTEKYQTSSKLHRVKATEWHRISLAVLSMGGDPTDLNGINLIADGTYNRYQDSGRKLDAQGINGPMWALIALDTKDYTDPDQDYDAMRFEEDGVYSTHDLIQYMLAHQMRDGGFNLSYGDGSAASDTDMTGMAIQSLSLHVKEETAYTYETLWGETVTKTVAQVVEEALDVMSGRQLLNGSFPSYGASSTCESTAQMLLALCSLGIDPCQDERFIKNGRTLVDGLLLFHTEDGGFSHLLTQEDDGSGSVPGQTDLMATDQAMNSLVSYWRLRNNMRNLYDFRPETNQKEIIIKAGENLLSVPFDREQKEYEIELSAGTELQFVNLPVGPYDKSNLSTGIDIDIKTGDILNWQITDRMGQVHAYRLIFKEKQAVDPVAQLIQEIERLPQEVKLTDKDIIFALYDRYQQLDPESQTLVSNLEILTQAIKRIQMLEKQAEENQMDTKMEGTDTVPASPKTSDPSGWELLILPLAAGGMILLAGLRRKKCR